MRVVVSETGAAGTMERKGKLVLLVGGGVVILAALSCCIAGIIGTGPPGLEGAAPDPPHVVAQTQVVVPPAATPTSPEKPEELRPADPDPMDLCASAERDLPDFDRTPTLRVDVVVRDDHRVQLVVRSNLPEGTILMTTVTGQAFRGGQRMELTRPCVASSPFGPMPLGSHTAEVLTPNTAIQPRAVREVFGERGRNLHGPQLERDGHQRRLAAQRQFRIGSPEEAAVREHPALSSPQLTGGSRWPAFASLRLILLKSQATKRGSWIGVPVERV